MSPHLLVKPVLNFPPPIVAGQTMSSEEQKMLGQFIILGPLRFLVVVGENSYEFLIACPERLHNLMLVESHGGLHYFSTRWVNKTTLEVIS